MDPTLDGDYRNDKITKARIVLTSPKFLNMKHEDQHRVYSGMIAKGLRPEDLQDLTMEYSGQSINMVIFNVKKSEAPNNIINAGQVYLTRLQEKIHQMADAKRMEERQTNTNQRQTNERQRGLEFVSTSPQTSTSYPRATSIGGVQTQINNNSNNFNNSNNNDRELTDVQRARLLRRKTELDRSVMSRTEAEAQEYDRIVATLYLDSTIQQNKLVHSASAVRARSPVRKTSPIRARSPVRKTSPTIIFTPPTIYDNFFQDEYNYEITDDMAGTVETKDLLDQIAKVLEKELRLFGRSGTFVVLLETLAQKVNRVYKDFAKAVTGRKPSPEIPLSIYVDNMNEWRSELQEIKEGQIALGRRCVNDVDPITLEPIDELDDETFIRLETGKCYHIESLLDLIKNSNGINKMNPKQNNSPVIWETLDDLNRIRRHPFSEKSGFTDWFDKLNFKASANIVSNATLDKLVASASFLASRGPDFEKALNKELNPQQRRALLEAEGVLEYINNREILNEITIIVNTVIKSAAVADFYHYYMRLSQEERDALNVFENSLDRSLKECHAGKFCVLGMSDLLLSLRNSIAHVKGLPPVDFGNRYQ